MKSDSDRVLHTLSPREKAFELNLKRSIYGTFAEIGGGQEVAHLFFKAGQASGTVAKAISAYDMRFSDSIYGPCKSYVSEDRLKQILDKEYHLLIKRLTPRAKSTLFFAFANTIQMASSRNNYVGHGWIGIRFQSHVNAEPNDFIAHVTLKEKSSTAQQRTLGIVGVNLLYACYQDQQSPHVFVPSLLEGISAEKIEIDMMRFSGPRFQYWDHRLLSLLMVKHGLTNATIFEANGNILQPYETISQKNILLLRGRFKPVTKVITDMVESGWKAFHKESPNKSPKETIVLLELSLKELASSKESVDEEDFIERADLLCALGYSVLISNFAEYYKLTRYLSAIMSEGKSLGILLGVRALEKIFDEKYYQGTTGGLLKALSFIHGLNHYLYVYPTKFKNTGSKILRARDSQISERVKPLFDFFVQEKRILDIPTKNLDRLSIISDDILSMIQSENTGWEQYLPEEVVDKIKKNALFGCPLNVPLETDDE
ncbi:MAG: TonB-dependent receptor [Cytophagales bacterium]|nr:TonB-dependent receptor [Cytophagales bacterium]